MAELHYRVIIEPLSPDDGGGFLATAPDLPGCRSDGETPEEALLNVQGAIEEWIEEAVELGYSIPLPTVRIAAAE